jgi:hypothetical protein
MKSKLARALNMVASQLGLNRRCDECHISDGPKTQHNTTHIDTAAHPTSLLFKIPSCLPSPQPHLTYPSLFPPITPSPPLSTAHTVPVMHWKNNTPHHTTPHHTTLSLPSPVCSTYSTCDALEEHHTQGPQIPLYTGRLAVNRGRRHVLGSPCRAVKKRN